MSNYVVSISREFGSGGRLIGKKLAASLGIPCYDRTLIQKTAEKSGLSPDFIARAEERARSRFHLNIAPIGIGVPTFTHQGIPVSHQAFFAQADVIRELAAEGPCVIVGRCADYILREQEDCLNVFIHASMAARADRIVRLYGSSEKSPEKRLEEKDKRRRVYYKHYTDGDWGMSQNYHLSLDSGVIGVEKCVSMIVELVRSR